MTDLSLPPVLLDGLRRYLGADAYDFRYRGALVTTRTEVLVSRVNSCWEHLVGTYHAYLLGAQGQVVFGDAERPGQAHLQYALSMAVPTEPPLGPVSDRAVRAAFGTLLSCYLELQARLNNASRVRGNAAAVRGAFRGLDRKNPGLVFTELDSGPEHTVMLLEDESGHVLKYSASATRDRILYGGVKGPSVCDDLEHSSQPYFPTQGTPGYPAWVHFMSGLTSGTV